MSKSIRNINRRIKAAMQSFITNESDDSLKSLKKLMVERENALKLSVEGIAADDELQLRYVQWVASVWRKNHILNVLYDEPFDDVAANIMIKSSGWKKVPNTKKWTMLSDKIQYTSEEALFSIYDALDSLVHPTNRS